VRQSAEEAGRYALVTVVARYRVAFQPPTSGYAAFVTSPLFLGSDDLAAQAAAEAAVLEKKNNSLFNADSIRRVANQAALLALRDVLSEAARTARNELPLAGRFGPGIGDPRLTYLIRQTNAVESLAAPALTGSVFLPANHPTNPFRHRRHPDHTSGFDILRLIRLDFDARAGGVLPRAGYGVQRITGVYREEIFGLHKPLGPQKNKGLKVEGTFELNRISLIDTLNAR